MDAFHSSFPRESLFSQASDVGQIRSTTGARITMVDEDASTISNVFCVCHCSCLCHPHQKSVLFQGFQGWQQQGWWRAHKNHFKNVLHHRPLSPSLLPSWILRSLLLMLLQPREFKLHYCIETVLKYGILKSTNLHKQHLLQHMQMQLSCYE